MLKRILLALLCGALLSAAMPPYSIVVLAAVALSGLYLLNIRAKTGAQAFWIGWSFGFAHFVSGIYWVAFSMLVEPEKFAWLIPLAVSVLPAYLALFIGAASWVTWKWGGAGISRVFVFAAAWSVMEMLRGWLLTGFPWNLLGYSWMDVPAMLQLTSLVGIYGLGLLSVLFFCLPALLYLYYNNCRPRRVVAVIIAVLVLCLVWGNGRIDNVLMQAPEENVLVHVVQGNIAQKMKWDEATRRSNMLEHFTLTQEALQQAPADTALHLIVWPETAVPYLLEEQRAILAKIAQDLPENAVLITGSLRLERAENEAEERIYNSLFALDGEGRVLAAYDKVKLVPFGEFVPLRRFLPFIDKITHGAGDFSAGGGAKTLLLGVPAAPAISPLICYETIFPAYYDAAQRPQALVNVTNDAWFGDTSGPPQHLASAQVRAIEQGVPMLRAANTGISSIIDAYGRRITTQGLNARGFLSAPLPGITAIPTLYNQYGNTLVLLGQFLMLMMVLVLRRNERE